MGQGYAWEASETRCKTLQIPSAFRVIVRSTIKGRMLSKEYIGLELAESIGSLEYERHCGMCLIQNPAIKTCVDPNIRCLLPKHVR